LADGFVFGSAFAAYCLLVEAFSTNCISVALSGYFQVSILEVAVDPSYAIFFLEA
jgi:hypothetical protein